MKTTKILAGIALAAGMLVALSACENEEAATYKKLNGKWVAVSSTQTISLEGKTIKEETRDADAADGAIYFLSDTTGAMQNVYSTSLETFSYEYKPSTKTLIITYDDGYGRRASYGSYTINAQLEFIDDNTFTMSYTYYDRLSESSLFDRYEYELDEDERNEDDMYMVKIDAVSTVKRVTE